MIKPWYLPVISVAMAAAGGNLSIEAIAEVPVVPPAVAGVGSGAVRVIPKPSRVDVRDGHFEITDRTAVLAAGADGDAARAVRFLTRTFEEDTGHALPVVEAAALSDVSTIAFVKNEAYAEEAYRLSVTRDAITIEASGYPGYLYGIQTLRQMVLSHPELPGDNGQRGFKLTLGSVTITDAPRYPWRGFMLDSARNFQSVDAIKRYLDYLAFIKMNRFHWHLTDAQGWRIEIKRYPELIEKAAWRGTGEDREGGYYTQAELKDIVAYAKERNIIVVPEIEMPAHCDCVLYTYPELSCHGEVVEDTEVVHIQHFLKRDVKHIGYFTQEQIEKGKTERVGRNYCAGKDEVFEFLQNVLTEVMEVFDSHYIHVGGDERVGHRWPKCPQCRDRMTANGLENDDQLQKYFMERIVRFLREHGRQGVMWAENPEHGIPDGVIVQAWRGKESEVATRAGHAVINSLNPYRYLDYFEYEHMKGTHWLPGMSMEKAYEFESYPEKQKRDLGRTIGVEAPLWTSWVEEYEVEESMFPRLLAVAEDGWYSGGAPKDFPEFKTRVDDLEGVLGSLGVRYAKPLADAPIQLSLPATIETSMKQWKSFMPEFAIDRGLYRYFWSDRPPVKGDHFTVNLDSVRACRRIRVYSGQTNEKKHALRDAVLEISSDGVSFEEVAMFDRRRKVVAEFPNRKTVKSVRIRFVAGVDEPSKRREGTVIIRGIRLD